MDYNEGRFNAFLQSANRVVSGSNPEGCNSLESYVIRRGEMRKVSYGFGPLHGRQIKMSEIEDDDVIIFVGTKWFHGEPAGYRVFIGKLDGGVVEA